ncbi:Hypothetical protein D9617_16g015470 [Elsinoe fawcettii]|nr:Hypothetical protein D9617_16g015470 [Elsinoe fawcettii]
MASLSSSMAPTSSRTGFDGSATSTIVPATSPGTPTSSLRTINGSYMTTSLEVTYESSWPTPIVLTNNTIYNTTTRTSRGSTSVVVFPTQVLKVGAPDNCKGYFLGGRDLEPNPDVSGMGVLVAFVASAWLVWIAVLYAFRRRQVSSDQIKYTDRRFFKAKASQAGSEGTGHFQNAMLVLSDQQLVTGIAILVAALVNMRDISSFHYSFSLQLAWLSSNVHLSAMLILREYLRKHPRYMKLRLGGMIMLFLLLMVALIPTHMEAYQRDVLAITRALTKSVPARCFWQVAATRKAPETPFPIRNSPADALFRNGVNVDGQSIFSAMILAGTFFWRLLGMFDTSRNGFRSFFQERPGRFLERHITRMASMRGTSFRVFTIPRISLIIIYLLHTLLWDTLDSFAGSIWFITINLATATAQLFLVRLHLSKADRQAESKWTFGQIVPLVLLILPVLSLFEGYLTAVVRSPSSKTKPTLGIPRSSSYAYDQVETINVNVKDTDAGYAADVQQQGVENRHSSVQTMKEQVRSLKVYIALFWEIHLSLLFATIWIPLSKSYLFGYLGTDFWIIYAPLIIPFAALAGTILLMLPFTRLFWRRTNSELSNEQELITH